MGLVREKLLLVLQPRRLQRQLALLPPSATDVARHRAQSRELVLEPPAASPGRRHFGNPLCVLAVRDWIAPAPDATSRTFALGLLASRTPGPIPPQCPPGWFSIWGRRFHDTFFGLSLDRACSQRSQLFLVAAEHSLLKPKLAISFPSGQNYGRPLFMN